MGCEEGVQPGTVLTVAVPSAREELPSPSVNHNDSLVQAREVLLPRPNVVNAPEA